MEGSLYGGRAGGDGDDLGLGAAIAETEGFFDAVLVHGVHDELAVFEGDCAVGDVYTLFGVKDLAKVGQYPHVFTLSSVACLWFDSWKLSGVVDLVPASLLPGRWVGVLTRSLLNARSESQRIAFPAFVADVLRGVDRVVALWREVVEVRAWSPSVSR